MNVFIILDAIRVVKYMCKQRLFSVGGNLKKRFCLHFNTLLKFHIAKVGPPCRKGVIRCTGPLFSSRVPLSSPWTPFGRSRKRASPHHHRIIIASTTLVSEGVPKLKRSCTEGDPFLPPLHPPSSRRIGLKIACVWNVPCACAGA